MEIKEITSKKIWQKFFDEAGSPSFLQSWEWGEFQKGLNYGVLRLGIYSNNNLKAIAQIIKIKSRRGNFLFVPHGPIFGEIQNSKFQIQNYIEKMKNFLIPIAKNEGFSFLRIAPILEDRGEYQKIFQVLGFRTAPIYMHAETVWVLPLNKTEEELLSNMRKTTRYLIKKAQRDGVIIEKRTDEKAVDDFYKIYQETAKREKFTPFSKEFIKKEFEAFKKTNNAIFLFGKIKDVIRTGDGSGGDPNVTQWPLRLPSNDKNSKDINFQAAKSNKENQNQQRREGNFRQDLSQNKYLAAALILFTPSAAFYHQGASLHTKIPVAYLLQWEAIRQAKNRRCQFYNFWGIYDEKSGRTPKSWKGLTLFKTGFGGQVIRYLPTQDYLILPNYFFTYLWEKLIWWKRRF